MKKQLLFLTVSVAASIAAPMKAAAIEIEAANSKTQGYPEVAQSDASAPVSPGSPTAPNPSPAPANPRPPIATKPASNNPALPSKPGIKFDVRADWRNADAYSTADGEPQRRFSEFELFRARLVFTGTLGENLIGTIRLNFLRDAEVTKDNTNNIVNWAFIKHKVSDQLAINAGKIWLFVGGIENLYSGADLYFISLGAEGQRQNLTGGSVDFIPIPNNVITPYVVNNDDPTPANQKKLGYGISYRGSLLENSVTIMGNYTRTYLGAQDVERPRNLAALGAQYKPNPNLGLDLGYVINQDVDSTPAGNATVTSVVSQVRYVTGHWSPWLKGEFSTTKTGIERTSYNRTRIGIAIEYKPEVEKYFRYHVAWVHLHDKYKDEGLPNPNVNQSEIIIGMRMVADIL